MSSDLVIVGSVAFDTVETRAGKVEEMLGGSATHAAVAASRLCTVRLVGVVGEHDFPAEHTRFLEDHGIDLSGLERAPGRTFRWAGRYAPDFSSRETLMTELGAFERFEPKLPASHREPRVLLLGNIHPALQHRVLDQITGRPFVVADTMNLWIAVARDELVRLIGRVDLLVVNDEESAELTGAPQIRVAAERILAMGPRLVIIKRGEHGAWLFSRDTAFFAPAFPLDDVIDPTGAGDTFAGGLAGFLAAHDGPIDAGVRRGMIQGAALASFNVGGFGVAGLAGVTPDQIDRRVAALLDLVRVD